MKPSGRPSRRGAFEHGALCDCMGSMPIEAGPASDINSGVNNLDSFSDPFQGSYQREEIPCYIDSILFNLLFL